HALGALGRGRHPGGRVRRSLGAEPPAGPARGGPAGGPGGPRGGGVSGVVARRRFLEHCSAAGAALGAFTSCATRFRGRRPMTGKPHVVVVGAGAFGGWTALYLLRSGARVTLLDAWGPGNSRASSGGETRVMRGAYGPNQPYTKMAARAMELWKDHEAQWRQKFFHPIGVLWMVEGDEEFERGSLPMLKDAGIPFEQLQTSDLSRRWTQINFEKVEWGIWEPQSGYLLARASSQAVVEHFVAEGGEYRQEAVLTPDL